MSWFSKFFGAEGSGAAGPYAPNPGVASERQRFSQTSPPGAGAHDPTGEPQRYSSPSPVSGPMGAQPSARLTSPLTKRCSRCGATIPAAASGCHGCGASG